MKFVIDIRWFRKTFQENICSKFEAIFPDENPRYQKVIDTSIHHLIVIICKHFLLQPKVSKKTIIIIEIYI